MTRKLSPRLRAALDFLWQNLPAVAWENVPDHLRGAVCHLETCKPRWARTIGIGDVPYVELLAAGAGALEDDRDWDEVGVCFEGNGGPRLVTISDVAKMVRRSPKTIRKSHTDAWGNPTEAAAGRLPARWRLDQIRPILAEQFPDADFL